MKKMTIAVLAAVFGVTVAHAGTASPIYAGVDASTEASKAAILTVNGTVNQDKGFSCFVRGINPRRGEGPRNLPYGPATVVVKPGIYEVSVVFQDSRKEGFEFKEYTFAAGKQYAVDCTGSTPNRVRISVKTVE